MYTKIIYLFWEENKYISFFFCSIFIKYNDICCLKIDQSDEKGMPRVTMTRKLILKVVYFMPFIILDFGHVNKFLTKKGFHGFVYLYL